MNHKNIETTEQNEQAFVEPQLEYVQPSLVKQGSVQEVTLQDAIIFSVPDSR